MKKLIFSLTLFVSLTVFAQSSLKQENISMIKESITSEYGHNIGFDRMEKWIIYDIKSNLPSTQKKRKPAMVYLIDDEGVIIEQNYFIYDSDFKVYSPECNCCHLETHMFFSGIKMHCETDSCTSKPAENISDLEKYEDDLEDMLIKY